MSVGNEVSYFSLLMYIRHIVESKTSKLLSEVTLYRRLMGDILVVCNKELHVSWLLDKFDNV